jgi:hypothetical protein
MPYPFIALVYFAVSVCVEYNEQSAAEIVYHQNTVALPAKNDYVLFYAPHYHQP